ncbi:mercuric transporter MerT family protein [Shewanella sp. A32]|nr:mercuric transporter MerT family protein [Shewanella sp. A32]MDF0535520.1 mercuric transporter MerT family protein [Shewanella sp. A32]
MITSQQSSAETQTSARGFVATIVTAVVAAVASSLCCIGPLLYLVFGVSAASLSGAEQLTWLHYPMLLLSTALIAMGFWRLYFSRRPLCTGTFSRTKMLILYWIAVPLVLAFQLYPYVLPWILERFE